MHVTQGLMGRGRHRRQQARSVATAVALLVVGSFAVVGIASPSSAHDNSQNVTEVAVPEIAIQDYCGPANATYTAIPLGPWVSVLNADGSLALTAQEGFVFPGDLTTITFATPVDSNVACETPTPDVSVVEVLVVRADTRFVDKCGRGHDLYKVLPRKGVRYRANRRSVRAGVWLHSTKSEVKIRAFAVDKSYLLRGKRKWTVSFTNTSCPPAPDALPHTGV